MAKTSLSGDRALVAALKQLANGVSGADIDRGAAAALDPMLKGAKAKLHANRNFVGKYPNFPQPKSPPKGGHVDEGLIVRRQTGTKTSRRYKLGGTRRARFLLHLLEFGTAPHFQPHFKGGFMHPGARPKPALTPAFEEHRDKVPDAFGRFLWELLAARAARFRSSRNS